MPRYAELASGRAVVVRVTACCLLPSGFSLGKLSSPSQRPALTPATHRQEAEPDTDALSKQGRGFCRLLRTCWKVRGWSAGTFVLFTCVAQAPRTVPEYLIGVQ